MKVTKVTLIARVKHNDGSEEMSYVAHTEIFVALRDLKNNRVQEKRHYYCFLEIRMERYSLK